MKIDVSIVSFVLVLIVAIPVTALRSQTYSVGYEIANLKAKERILRASQMILEAELAKLKAAVIETSTSFDFPETARTSNFEPPPQTVFAP